MAWIIFDQKLERHTKTKHLMALMGWDLDTALGKLARFWFWCQTFAEDGQLGKFSDIEIADGVGIGPEGAAAFVKAMKVARWIDRKPCQVHDWWDHAGPFLRKRYNKKPDVWKRIESLYKGEPKRSTPGELPEDTQEGSGSEHKRREKKRREDPPRKVPEFELVEPTDGDDRLKWLLERQERNGIDLPWGTMPQEESARETLARMHRDHGEAEALRRLVAAYGWAAEGMTYRAPSSIPQLLMRLKEMEEAAAAQPTTAPKPTGRRILNGSESIEEIVG